MDCHGLSWVDNLWATAVLSILHSFITSLLRQAIRTWLGHTEILKMGPFMLTLYMGWGSDQEHFLKLKGRGRCPFWIINPNDDLKNMQLERKSTKSEKRNKLRCTEQLEIDQDGRKTERSGGNDYQHLQQTDQKPKEEDRWSLISEQQLCSIQ